MTTKTTRRAVRLLIQAVGLRWAQEPDWYLEPHSGIRASDWSWALEPVSHMAESLVTPEETRNGRSEIDEIS